MNFSTFQVDNWADNEALRNPTQNYSKPIYRRSFSELSTAAASSISHLNHLPNVNRRSLERSDLLLPHTTAAFPKSSTSMTDIQSSQQQQTPLPQQHSQSMYDRLNSSFSSRNLNRSTSDISEGGVYNTVYTYIGISGPEDKDKSHVYENCAMEVNKKGPDGDRNAEMYAFSGLCC